MTAHLPRLTAGLILIALFAGGCTLGRSRSTASPREQPNASAMTTDLEALRLENERLRAQQGALESRLADVQSKLAQSQEEQRRFRESMVTNFDLLEQSVALTLSKTITADLNDPGTRRPAASSPKAAAPVATRPAAPAQRMAAAESKADDMRQALPVVAQADSPAAKMTPAAMAAATRSPMAEAAAVQDPDLLPPANPTQLTAHREAKSLYEKGFALFARKDYDAAVIVFENFLKRYPDDIYSDNAQFWIAESLMNMNRSQEAEAAYRAVLRNYEHRSTLEGYKTPDAIYRLGQVHLRRAELQQARQYFEALGERFPETSAGRKAMRELATLGTTTAQR